MKFLDIVDLLEEEEMIYFFYGLDKVCSWKIHEPETWFLVWRTMLRRGGTFKRSGLVRSVGVSPSERIDIVFEGPWLVPLRMGCCEGAWHLCWIPLLGVLLISLACALAIVMPSSVRPLPQLGRYQFHDWPSRLFFFTSHPVSGILL